MPKYDPITNITLNDIVPMADDHSVGVTSHAAMTTDATILGIANSKTAVRFYDNGIAMNGTALTGDIIIWVDSITTSGGTVTFYLTSTHDSSGTALCSSISASSVDASPTDSTGVFARGTATVAGNLKSVSVPITKQTLTGITVVGIPVLGSSSQGAAPDGVTVKLYAMGVAA